MTTDITNPSRRSVAKGAAWAVPAVAVAATAPSLAASTTYCTETPTFTIDTVCPPTDIDVLDGNSESLYFVVTNTSGCTVEAGQEFTLDTTNLAGVTVEGLNTINAGVAVFGADGRTGTLSQDLADGASVNIYVFPVADLDVNLAVIGSTTLTIEAASLTQAYTLIEADAIGALAVTLAFCGGDTLIEVLLDGLGATVGEVLEILVALGLGGLIP